jgi:hypothetical protein
VVGISRHGFAGSQQFGVDMTSYLIAIMLIVLYNYKIEEDP